MIEPATRFCGRDAPIGSPYCAAHRALACLGFPRAPKGTSLHVIDGAGYSASPPARLATPT
jgi:hypothetical protein